MIELVTASLACGLGGGLGVAAAWVAARLPPGTGRGPWRTLAWDGRRTTGLRTRAQAALQMPFALPPDQALYFIAGRDGTGQRLAADRDYQVRGSAPAARCWTLTAYGDGHHLMPNAERRYSFHDGNVTLDRAGYFDITLSRTPHAGNWIPLVSSRRIYLMLRIYLPAAGREPAWDGLPEIRPVARTP